MKAYANFVPPFIGRFAGISHFSFLIEKETGKYHFFVNFSFLISHFSFFFRTFAPGLQTAS